MKEHKSANKTISILSAMEHYNDAIGKEAVARVGNNTQLKGVIHENLYMDKCNLNNLSRLKGDVTTLTKNPRAPSVDVVTTNKGKVVSRYQLKDCTSDSGVRDTLKRVRKGQYKNTQLMGTEETAEKYNRMKSSKDRAMKSTGISSKRTGRIADNAGAKSPDKNTVMNNFKDIGSCAVNSAGIGAVSSAAGSIYSNLEKYKNGEIDELEYMEEVAKDTANGAAKSAATTATALSLKEGGKALGDAIGSEGFRKFMGSNGGTAVAYGIADITVKTGQLINGSIDRDEYTQSCAKSVVSSLGGYEGALIGGELGTLIFPGVGTSIGAGIGAGIGAIGGAEVVDLLYQYNLAEVFADSVRAVCSTTSECSEAISNMALNGAEFVGDAVSDTYEAVTDFVSEGADTVTEIASNAADFVGDTLSETCEAVTDFVSEGADTVTEIASNAVDFVGDTLSETCEAVTDFVSEGADTVTEIASNAADFVGDSFDSVCDGVSSLCDSIFSLFD